MTFLDRFTAREIEASRITQVIAGRIREVIPSGEFIVEINDGLLSVIGVNNRTGNSYHARLLYVWLLPLPTKRRLRMVFEGQGRGLQGFLTRVRRAPWPKVGAQLNVSVTDRVVDVWWDSPHKDGPIVKLRTIPRGELGV
jgi:hypothetical protein